ncbi:NUDIX domain-containing protein [Salipiger thiooxidans]|uniref:NUDIX domain-containing protein n=1 Tax=Salipiger thiooxidans TaxID=282683 RepID=UPI001CD6D2A1|nr:NUDIX domain-containing protein [Salipiger thiooxidans]MCA0847685.1 NUDIX domain-containing protein [Salipiger thiooxidans]
MTNIFVFGTLCHRPLLERVLDRPVEAETARLPDLAVYLVQGKGLPNAALCQSAGAAAEGWLIRDAGPADVERLAFYLSGLGSEMQQAEVLTASHERVTVTVPLRACPPDACGPLFSFEEWRAEWGDAACDAAREIMAQHGQAEIDEIGRLRPYLEARAWALQLGRHGAPAELRSNRGREAVEFLGDRPGWEGFFRMRAFTMRHRRFDGSWTEPLRREAFMAYDGALVLPYDPETDRVLLVEQLRFGPTLRGDPHPWVLEPVAGLVDAGESPEVCALREAEEEAGVTLRDLRPMMRIYASPGYSTEYFHCFLGFCSLSERDNGVGGLEEENEDIRSHVISFDRAMELVDSGEINVGPLAMMLYWLARHREELRRGA